MGTIKEEGELEEALTCGVCHELYCDPHLLPCGHSFCLLCVRPGAGVEAWLGAGQGGCKCPDCGEEYSATTPLHKNYRLANIALEYRRRGLPGGRLLVPVPCDCCPVIRSAMPAVKTCLRCEVSLCALHLQPHLDCPAFHTHLLVEPLDDLSKRRCHEHGEMFRYYCTNENVYVCADCILEGKHTGHQVKSLRKMEKDLKTILQGHLQKAEEKLRHSQKVLMEQKNVDGSIMDAWSVDSGLERLGASLVAQVELMVGDLCEEAQVEKQQAKDRLRVEQSRVIRDLRMTQDIHKYLRSLLEQRDPFLIIWAFQSEDKKISAELNTAVFQPEPSTLDRKRVLENIDRKYRQFLSETLKCLNELKRDFSGSVLTLDADMVHPVLCVSGDLLKQPLTII
ncbi:hypothetical protein AGOR_G00187370 [Albula goreensis]|uniref:Uncharacterized protein n=1 Tax=Albula goreensis TaxID=1534307 RepID=A0A8T3CZ59_9TELE|nr:hypothetical protein AGOR_G00187370 [Albula goreensis]